MSVSTPEEFVKVLREALGAVAPHLGAPAQQLVVAHAAFESGWGKSKPAREGFNLFNVTRIKSDTRPVVESGDLEYRADGSVVRITQRFAKYGSLAEGLADYFRLLSSPRYAKAIPRLEAGDLAGFAAELKAGGYFTLPIDQYLGTLGGVLAGVRKRWG